MILGKYEIKTSYDYPPIPVRTQDYSAWCDGYEGDGMRIGRGATEQLAIDDLREQLEDTGLILTFEEQVRQSTHYHDIYDPITAARHCVEEGICVDAIMAGQGIHEAGRFERLVDERTYGAVEYGR